MIEDVVERWHRFITGNLPGGLDDLLADDVVVLLTVGARQWRKRGRKPRSHMIGMLSTSQFSARAGAVWSIGEVAAVLTQF